MAMERPPLSGLAWSKKTERSSHPLPPPPLSLEFGANLISMTLSTRRRYVVRALDANHPKEMFDLLEKGKKDLVHGSFTGIGLLQNRQSKRRISAADVQRTEEERKVDLLLQLWDKILSMVNRGLSIVKYIVKSYEYIGGIIKHPEIVCLPINVREGERNEFMKRYRSLLYRSLCHLHSQGHDDFAEDKQNFAVRVVGVAILRCSLNSFVLVLLLRKQLPP
jgi:hypothetical protein